MRYACSEARGATASRRAETGSAPENAGPLFEYGPTTSVESQHRPSLFPLVHCCGERPVLGSLLALEAGTAHELHDTARKAGGDLSIPPIQQNSAPRHWPRR